VFAQAIARPFDLDHDGVVKQSVEEGGRDDGVAEDVTPLGEAAV
jgi:hypothetical protein